MRLHLARRPRQLTHCNCSICRRYGCLWTYASWKTVHLACPRGVLARYVWGGGRLAFHHCKTCGCVTHHARADRKPSSTVAVNARLLEPRALAALRVRHVDGASSGKTLGYSTWTGGPAVTDAPPRLPR